MKRYIVWVIALCIAMFLSGCGTGINMQTSEEFAIEDKILKDYMMGAGYEYEDTLVLDLSERFDKEVTIYDAEELSPERIESRNEKEVIVERCFGMVTSQNGDGLVLHPYDEDFGYISYRSCEGIREGMLIVTYMVYNPENTYLDDIIERYDCVVSHELED